MNEKSLRVLEYDKVKDLLAGFTITDPGREKAEAIAPLGSREEVVETLSEVTETMALLKEAGRPPVGGCQDLRPYLRQVRAEGAWLSPTALLEVLSSVEAARDCRRHFSGHDRAPRLAALSGRLNPLKELGQALRESIGARGEVLDSASPELGDLRRQTLVLRSRIRRALEDLLVSERLAAAFQDRIITERGGRYVVPLRADHRGQVKGFIHDESASGQTLYLEPVAVLERNNELQALQRQEQREVERVLRRLSRAVRQASAELGENQEVLARLDLLSAAGQFALRSGGVAPQLAEGPVVELRQARHPLLLFTGDGSPRDRPAVPVDLLLGEDSDTLVISGPNTGGKTVALKTAGLLVLMVRSGLPVPCRPDSRVGLFGKVFADIGDEQSIEEDLSTFSGHLTRIGQILEQADGDSLVLLDEAGTGTDPAEGGALAMAVLDSLRDRGARTIVTTHLNLVKGYAQIETGVENAAVEFDEQTLAPTYRLHYGIPGASSAFTIARRLGLPEDVLERAGGYLRDEEREGLNLLERLNRLRKELEQDRVEAAELRRRAHQERERRKALLTELEEKKRGILEKATRRGEQMVRETEGRLKTLLKEAGAAAPDTAAKARIGGEFRDVREDLARRRPAPPRRGLVPKEVAVGEILRVPALGAEAEVARVQGKEAELLVQGKKLRLPLADLEQFSPRRFRGKAPASRVRSAVTRDVFNPRLMLVGQRAEDALLLLDRFLDDALLQGQEQLEVVHGAGEGILRRVVRDYLGGHRAVKAFHAADLAHGGNNVTVVELRG